MFCKPFFQFGSIGGIRHFRKCSRDVAVEIDIEFTVHLEVVSGPAITHGVEKIYAAIFRNGDQRIFAGCIPTLF